MDALSKVIVKYCPEIEYLKLYHEGFEDLDAFVHVLENCSKLHTIDLSALFEDVDDETILFLFDCKNHIKKLIIANNDNITTETVIKILEMNQQIEMIELTYCDEVDFETVQKYVDNALVQDNKRVLSFYVSGDTFCHFKACYDKELGLMT